MKNKKHAHTMASEQLEPWMPRWVREKLREYNNDLTPNDPNRDNKPPVGEDTLVQMRNRVSLLL
jgi:hypothetical protein